jgi:enamine deaminase RidA (YjgF/YER057c/UK114 family)
VPTRKPLVVLGLLDSLKVHFLDIHKMINQKIVTASNLGLPPPFLSHAVKTGNTIYLSGQLGINPVTKKLVPGGIKAETRQAVKNIREVLR